MNNEKLWSGEFGNMYIKRNNYDVDNLDQLYVKNIGISRTELNSIFLKEVDRGIKILEVGSNIGLQLQSLQKMGFSNLFGVEINKEAIVECNKRSKDIYIVYGLASDIPFKDGFFDLVFTSGLLIHIPPPCLNIVLKEIYRCSNQYIWGYEYFGNECEEVLYRGELGVLWRNNFSQRYMDILNLITVKEQKINYVQQSQTDVMFLLRKI